MFRSLLDHHQVYKELNMQRTNDFLGTQCVPNMQRKLHIQLFVDLMMVE